MHVAQKVRIILIAPAIIAIFILSGCFKKEKPEIKQQSEIETVQKTETNEVETEE